MAKTDLWKEGSSMQTLVQKRLIKLPEPGPDDLRAGRERVLQTLGMPQVRMTLPVLQALEDAMVRGAYEITLTLSPAEPGLDVTAVQPGDTTGTVYGLALDIGSTNLEMELVDLMSGRTLAKKGCLNDQTQLGTNILDRIFSIREDRENLRRLQALVLENIRMLIAACCEEAALKLDDIAAMTVGGNTTMMHLFLGCDPWHVFQSPYTPVFYDPGVIAAQELGLGLCCNVYCMPAIANYLGGDITSGLLETDMDTSEQISVFLDIGTNGELVLGSRDFLLAGAGAAGPALEGACSKSGMRAEPGAVCSVKIDGGNQLHIQTIDNLSPKGICGSGIVDLIAEGFLSGWIDADGTLNAQASPKIKTVWDEARHENVQAIVYARGENGPLCFTQDDVLEFIRCKAAAYTMVATLLDESGVAPEAISKFYLSGGFGTHLNLESAITIGMYPDLPREKFVILGNSSLAGAKHLLLDGACRARLEKIRALTQYVQFGEMEKFPENMVAAQFLPHTDLSRYPSVHRRV